MSPRRLCFSLYTFNPKCTERETFQADLAVNIQGMVDIKYSDTVASRFNRERLSWIREVERGHFWHAPRRRLFLDVIQRIVPAGARLLDVGCGTGALCAALSKRGFDAYGVDPHALAMGLDPERFSVGGADSLPWPEESFDMVCALDVLEHVDDRAAASDLWRVLKPGGLLLVSVPGYRWLWSERDVVAGHLRRYTRAELNAVLKDVGFQVERRFGYQFVLLPILAASRWWQRIRPAAVQVNREDRPGRLANAILRAVNDLEVVLGRVVRPPIGSSLVMIARKAGR